MLLIGGTESHSVPGAAALELRQQLRQVAAAHGVQDQVHFTGYLPDADISRLLQAADVAAFPLNAGVTRKSSSLLAALAAGLPAVATAPQVTVIGLSEIDGVLWVPPRDTTALSDALARVLSDRALAHRLTVTGRARAATHSWESIAAMHAQVYARTLAFHRAGGSWTARTEPSRVVPQQRLKGTLMSVRERMAQGAERLAVALRGGRSAGTPTGARETEDPSCSGRSFTEIRLGCTLPRPP